MTIPYHSETTAQESGNRTSKVHMQQFFSSRKGLSCMPQAYDYQPHKIFRICKWPSLQKAFGFPVLPGGVPSPPRVLRFQLARRVLLVLDQVPVQNKIKLGISKQDIQPWDHTIAYPAIITSRETYSPNICWFFSIVYSDYRIEIRLTKVVIFFEGTNSFTFYQETSGDAIQYKTQFAYP